MNNEDITIPSNFLDKEEYATTCEACSEGRKKKKDKCLSINVKDKVNAKGETVLAGAYRCNHCGDSGLLKSHRTFKPEKMNQEKEKSYQKPVWQNVTSLSDKVVRWFKDDRGISQRTLMEAKVTEGFDWMPKAKKEVKTIHFNYFRGGTQPEHLVNIKYRGPLKDFKLHKDAQKILYGMETIEGKTSAIIVEGEMGVLTWRELGMHDEHAVLSVPNGTTISKDEIKHFEKTGRFIDDNVLNLEYLDNSWDDIEHIEKWYIATDNDAPGLKLRKELIRRLGAEKCWIVDFGKYKDENDVLVNEGVLTLEQMFKKAYQPPIEGVMDLASQWEYVKDVHENGYQKGMSLGIEELEEYWNPKLDTLLAVGGIPNHGKTTFLAWLMVLTAKKFGWKWAVYSPENYPAGELFITIIEILVGASMDKTKPSYMTAEQRDSAYEFVQSHFFIVDSEEPMTPEDLLEKFRQLIKRKGINCCLIDPWNDLWHKRSGGETTEEYVQRQLSIIRRFKRKYNLLFSINYHPVAEAQRATEDDPAEWDLEPKKRRKRTKVPHVRDAAGGAMFYNRVDDAITIYRDLDHKERWNITEVHVQKVKFQKLVGTTTRHAEPVLLRFSTLTNRLVSENKVDPLAGTHQERKEEEQTKQAQDVPDDMPDFDKAMNDTHAYGTFQNHRGGMEAFENEGTPDNESAPF
jgi:twinkle protein